MGHRRTPQADSDLDSIWYYVASKSASIEIADRLIDSFTDRFFLLAKHPNIGRSAATICALACEVSPWASTSSSTTSKTRVS